jgi:nitric oxide dioxygenase
MVQTEIEIVRQSFKLVSADVSLVGDLFYRRLTETAPDVVSIFGTYFDGGGDKFQVISEVVDRHLRSLLSMRVTPGGQMAPIPPAVRQLGQRHAKYAITDVQFAHMKEALLWTLEQVLGRDFSPETRDAWSHAYDSLAEMIQLAMRQPEAAEKEAFARAADAPADGDGVDPIMKFFGRSSC